MGRVVGHAFGDGGDIMKHAICLGLLLCAMGAQAAELPVRQVILYKHGVGYFQRSGQLAAGESARLDFNASEMNDVLKSLTIVERGGGKISGLRYDSSEPLEKKLSEYPFRLGAGQSLSAVLDQLKGALIELKFGAETVRGAILSGRVTPRDERRPESEQLLLLLDSGEMRNFDLAAATNIRLLDSVLQSQFKDYLAALVGARSKDKRSVYIDSTGTQARQLIADYMIPMPVWKSSYRLIWDATAEPMLEGWAIVDNTTGEEWTNVQLSLVSGRPISFISRLYEPRYITRPTAELPEERAQRPVILQGAIDEAKVAEAPAQMRAQRMAMPASAPMAMEKDIAGAREEVASTITAAAAGQELGELFEYRFSTPVTVRRNESAMLPFLQQKLSARKLLIYLDPSSVHPMNSAELTNSSGKTLDGGPITVYEDNAYAGEALMETLKAGDKRLISYGVDLGTRLTTQFDSKGDLVREVHLRRGVLTTRSAAVETKTYTIRNVDQKAKTLIIEHPVRPQFKLTDQKPTETTANAYRFEVKLAAGVTEKFPVTEERVFENTLAISSITPDVLMTFVQNKNLSDATRAQLQQILDRKRQIAAVDGEIRRGEEQIRNLFQDQERLRQNINSLNRVAGQEQQVQAYSRQLAAQEAQLASLRDRQAESQRRKTALETELNSLIERMEF
ncbi:MAG: hypothetical protein A3J28_15225 [Acidobacteria bacterium RIFCSPLOWO2_12_FULL_60_22]|nr:MAG: hypothetical protein A3J28_15225 [Acidobacteria bacterium RIFCSPLOWO2_12_FULL_60_22]